MDRHDAEIERRALLKKWEQKRTDFDDVVSERDEIKEQRDVLEIEAEARESEAFDVLRAVRDWFDRVLLHKQPMTDPRRMLREVERALE